MEYNSRMPSYHIGQPDHGSGPLQPALCGSRTPNVIAFDQVKKLIDAGSVEQDDICSQCWIEFELRQKDVA